MRWTGTSSLRTRPRYGRHGLNRSAASVDWKLSRLNSGRGAQRPGVKKPKIYPTRLIEHFHSYWWALRAHRNTTVRTGPYTAVRDGYAGTSSNNDGKSERFEIRIRKPHRQGL